MTAVFCLTLAALARLYHGLGVSFLAVLTCLISLGSLNDLDFQMVPVAVSRLGSAGWGCGWWVLSQA